MIRGYVAVIAEVAATLEPGAEEITEREEKFEALIDRFEATEDPIRHGMATLMLSFLAGLFVGEEAYEGVRDNLDLERWFRLPKGHERRIHGHWHAGVRIVVEGPTLTLVANSIFLPPMELCKNQGQTEKYLTTAPDCPWTPTPHVTPPTVGSFDPRRDPTRRPGRLPQRHALPPHRR